MQQRNIVLALDSANMGGIETHVLTLAKQLVGRGHFVKVCFFQKYPGHPLYQRLLDAEIAFTFVGGVKGFWHFLKTMPIGTQLHTHGYKAGILGRLLGRVLKLNVVSTFHSGDLGRGKLKCYSLIDLATAHLGKAIAVSAEIARRLPQKTQLIPNFVALPDSFTVKAVEEGRRNVAFVGRLSEEKGPDIYCRLALASRDTPFSFKLYGDGPLATELAAEFGHCVDFKGAVVMEEHWKDVDVLCISSRAEGLPLVALEAMARGIPIVTFDVGGLAQLIDDPALGWIVPGNDLNGLKMALMQWHEMEESEKEQLRNAVYQRIEQHYCAQSLVGRIEALYA